MKENKFQNSYSRQEWDLEDADAVLEIPEGWNIPESAEYWKAPNDISSVLNRLRHAQSRLDTTLEYLTTIPSLGEKNSASIAVFEAAVTKYYSCFHQGQNSPHLNPKEVFKQQDQLLEAHNQLKALRDRFLNHPSADHFSSLTLIATDKSKVVDTPTLTFRYKTHTGEQLRSLIELCLHSQHFVKRKLELAMEKAHKRAEGHFSSSNLEGPFNLREIARELLKFAESNQPKAR